MQTYINLIRELQPLQGNEIVKRGLYETSLGNLENATYICDYLATRKKQRFRNQLIREMESKGVEPINFLNHAREIAQTFQKSTKGKNHVYVILLKGFARQPYGVYVGQTSRKVEIRFEQHISGHKHGGCTKFCVNGLIMGENPLQRRNYDRRSKTSSTKRINR
jgi:hypothetical protein